MNLPTWCYVVMLILTIAALAVSIVMLCAKYTLLTQLARGLMAI